MDTEREILSVLNERRESFNGVTAKESLAEPVNPDRFYQLSESIIDFRVDDRTVEVKFKSPVTNGTDFTDNYHYTVAVSDDEDVENQYNRDGIPRSDMIVLHQIAIVLWAIATGEVYNER